MYVASRFPVPVGLVRWKTNATCYSPFIKLTYDVGASGWALPASTHLPISEGDVESGRVLTPSDFADAKGACEVAVIGRALVEHTGLVRVRVGGLTRESTRIGALGAVAVGGGRDYFSSEEDRLPFPSMPLELGVEGVGPTIRALIPGPLPTVALAFDEGWGSLQRVPLFIDAVLIDPRNRRCAVVFRGFFAHPGDVDRGVTLVVDPIGRLEAVPASEIGDWARTRVREVAGASVDADDEEESFTPPFGHRIAEPDPSTQRAGESTVELRALSEERFDAEMTPDEEPKPETSKMMARPAQTPKAAGRPPLETQLSPEEDKGPAFTKGGSTGLPFQRARAQSGRPTLGSAPAPSVSQSEYIKTQAIAAMPSHRQTLPFVAPSELSKPAPAPREREARPRSPVDKAETTQLISMAAIRGSRDALPFGAKSEAPTRGPVDEPVEVKARPQRVAFELPPSDDERTELGPAPALPDEDEIEPVESELPTPPPPRPSASGTARPPPLGAFAGDESTAQIHLPLLRPALPFGGPATSDDTGPARGADARRSSTMPPPPGDAPSRSGTTPPPPFVEAIATQDDEQRPRVVSRTMPPPALPEIAAAPAWFSPTGAQAPPPPERAVALADLVGSNPMPTPKEETAKPVWRPREVALAISAPRSADKLPTLTLDEYASLRAELWAGARPRREVLKARGLTELRWRAVERKWAAEIDAASADPDKLMPILSRLQSFAERQPPSSV